MNESSTAARRAQEIRRVLAADHGKRTMEDTSGYFALIDELVAALPPDPERMGAVLDVALVRDEQTSGPFEVLWQGASPAGRGPFEQVMLRLPGPLAESRRATLVLQLAQSRFVTGDDIVDRYGTDYVLRLPSPRYPADAVPAYMTYDLPWGQLGFGVSPDEPGHLREILLQADVPVAAEADVDADA